MVLPAAAAGAGVAAGATGAAFGAPAGAAGAGTAGVVAFGTAACASAKLGTAINSTAIAKMRCNVVILIASETGAEIELEALGLVEVLFHQRPRKVKAQ